MSNPPRPYLIGIAGGSGSGKTSVANELFKTLQTGCLLFSMDTYYKDLTPSEMENISEYNFDAPSALDLDLLSNHLNDLLSWKEIEMPTYDFTTSSRKKETKKISPCQFIIFEGILAFYDKRIRNLMNMKIFVDLDDDIRLARRIYRDMIDRGRNMHNIISRYHKFVKPAFDNFIKPTRKFADVIIPRGAENTNAIELIGIKLKSEFKKIKNFDFFENFEDFDKFNFGNLSQPNIHKKSVDFFCSNLNDSDIFNQEFCFGKNLGKLKTILVNFLEMKNSVYYELYLDFIMKEVILFFQEEQMNYKNNFIIYPSWNKSDFVFENYKKKKINDNIKFIFILKPIFLKEKENIFDYIKFFSEEENIKKIILISIYLSENVVKKIKEINNNKIVFKSIYYGEKLDYYSYYIEKGGFFGKDSEGENTVFSENNIENYLTKKLLNNE